MSKRTQSPTICVRYCNIWSQPVIFCNHFLVHLCPADWVSIPTGNYFGRSTVTVGPIAWRLYDSSISPLGWSSQTHSHSHCWQLSVKDAHWEESALHLTIPLAWVSRPVRWLQTREQAQWRKWQKKSKAQGGGRVEGKGKSKWSFGSNLSLPRGSPLTARLAPRLGECSKMSSWCTAETTTLQYIILSLYSACFHQWFVAQSWGYFPQSIGSTFKLSTHLLHSDHMIWLHSLFVPLLHGALLRLAHKILAFK